MYASEILPELMKMFKEKLIIEYTKPECSSEVRMIFYALDKFIESMEGGIDEYIPEMINIVLDIIKNEQCCIELKDKGITIMCSIGKYINFMILNMKIKHLCCILFTKSD